MGLPYSSIAFSIKGPAAIDQLIGLVDRINDCLVRPLFLQVALSDGARSEVIDPLNLSSVMDCNQSNLLPGEVVFQNSEYSIVQSEPQGIWKRERVKIARLFESFASSATHSRTWTWLKFWGPTRILIPVEQEVCEVWALREFHKTSSGWNQILHVSIHYDPDDTTPIFLNMSFRSHVMSLVSTLWDRSHDEWEMKSKCGREISQLCARSFTDSLLSCLDEYELESWEYSNDGKVDLLGEIPSILALGLQMEPTGG